MTGWTRDLSGFHHLPRATGPVALARGAALRASIELGQHYPAPDEYDTAAMRAIREAGGIWGLPQLSGTLGEAEQVWQSWLNIYAQARAGDLGAGEIETEEAMRHDFLFYLHTIRQDLAQMARECAGGHANLAPSWLAELHHALVHSAGWSVAELVTHVMALHRQEHPACVKTDLEMIEWVASRTPDVTPLNIDESD